MITQWTIDNIAQIKMLGLVEYTWSISEEQLSTTLVAFVMRCEREQGLQIWLFHFAFNFWSNKSPIITTSSEMDSHWDKMLQNSFSQLLEFAALFTKLFMDHLSPSASKRKVWCGVIFYGNYEQMHISENCGSRSWGEAIQ